MLVWVREMWWSMPMHWNYVFLISKYLDASSETKTWIKVSWRSTQHFLNETVHCFATSNMSHIQLKLQSPDDEIRIRRVIARSYCLSPAFMSWATSSVFISQKRFELGLECRCCGTNHPSEPNRVHAYLKFITTWKCHTCMHQTLAFRQTERLSLTAVWCHGCHRWTKFTAMQAIIYFVWNISEGALSYKDAGCYIIIRKLRVSLLSQAYIGNPTRHTRYLVQREWSLSFC
jgi:hypothetical protein